MHLVLLLCFITRTPVSSTRHRKLTSFSTLELTTVSFLIVCRERLFRSVGDLTSKMFVYKRGKLLFKFLPSLIQACTDAPVDESILIQVFQMAERSVYNSTKSQHVYRDYATDSMPSMLTLQPLPRKSFLGSTKGSPPSSWTIW